MRHGSIHQYQPSTGALVNSWQLPEDDSEEIGCLQGFAVARTGACNEIYISKEDGSGDCTLKLYRIENGALHEVNSPPITVPSADEALVSLIPRKLYIWVLIAAGVMGFSVSKYCRSTAQKCYGFGSTGDEQSPNAFAIDLFENVILASYLEDGSSFELSVCDARSGKEIGRKVLRNGVRVISMVLTADEKLLMVVDSGEICCIAL